MIARTTALVAALFVSAAVAVAPASAAPGDPPGALTFGGLQRTYVLHVPPGLTQPAGLVINLHGAGQTGAVQAGVTNYNAVADQYGFVVAYPDGIDMSWADGRGASLPDREGVDDVGFLAALIAQLSRDFAIPPGRVFVTGMSAGAFMANRLACERADLVSAVAPVAGTLSMSIGCNPSRPVSVLAVHGTADPVVPYTGGAMVGRGGPSDIVSAPSMAERWRALDNCPAPPAPDPSGFMATGCAGGTRVEFVSVDGGGHVWPVGPAFNASAATGQFFSSVA
ncbi:PHB depolymerase family esterase [Mycobacterium sp. M26]|uniref:extracellular catalytic domain type 1 short-chain-length polyhydroxyalkanoate depolymerase n=1 Tax=Mycobacterium sp. M26 TaxID=1762962 RepID=UPI00073E87C0|nr:PHB depolymerase family esterase [Mycobacterium sp. M26]